MCVVPIQGVFPPHIYSIVPGIHYDLGQDKVDAKEEEIKRYLFNTQYTGYC